MQKPIQELLPETSVHLNLPAEELIRATVSLGQGQLSDTGALVVSTGTFTGRSPEDRFIVRDERTDRHVDWNQINQPLAPSHFRLLREGLLDYLNARKEVWVQQVLAGAHPDYRIPVTAVTETPWAGLFVQNMFIRPEQGKRPEEKNGWLILHAPGFEADPAVHGTRMPNFAVISFTEKTILIGGTGYTGEIKKGIFSVLNFLLPLDKGVLSMHCSANKNPDGTTALFFGLSGTGKTTLSADPERALIGDDEHGWHRDGIFNFEGGCYAKVINLSEDNEPEIYNAIRFGALVENTVFIEGTNRIDFTSRQITPNTRVSYPISFIRNAVVPSVGAVPSTIFFLACDSYGVLPPVSRLNATQAMYYFISGYTAKIAGTEEGITEPRATFSACFGAPFLPLHPGRYAAMLGDKIAAHDVKVWMVNTGWTGGPYGTGSRIKISYTRAMVNAALSGALDHVPYGTLPVFDLEVPLSCPGVPPALLTPRETWADKNAYDAALAALAAKFGNNFKKFEKETTAEIRAAGPVIHETAG